MSYAKPDGADGSTAVRSSSTATTRASLHRVESGRFAARVITPLGAVVTVWLGGPGDVFGLIAMVNPEQRRTATVVALEPAETLAIGRSAFMRLQASHPAVRDAVDQLLAARLAVTTDRLVEALYTPVASRVRFHLIQLAALYGDLEAGEVTIPLSQDHVAGLSGTTRETVNRVLKQEQERGAVRLGRGRIVATPVLLGEHPLGASVVAAPRTRGRPSPTPRLSG